MDVWKVGRDWMKIVGNKYFCEKCGTKLKRNEKYDAYYCKKCNEWAEGQCSDPDCFYCVGRPDKPFSKVGD